MIELNPAIEEALNKIEFIKRYEELSANFNSEKTPSSERLRYIDGEEVMEMLQDLGHKPAFDKKEKFYKIEEEQIGIYTFGFHIILRDGMATFVWVVKENNQLILGEPWSEYSRELIDINYRIKTPIFGTYEDLEEILKISFEMYEDFKKAITNH